MEYLNGEGDIEEEKPGGAGMHLCVEEEQMRSPSQLFRAPHGNSVDWVR